MMKVFVELKGMFRRLRDVMLQARVIAMFFGTGVFATVALMAGFLVDGALLGAAALMRSLLAGAITGLFVFELHRARVKARQQVTNNVAKN